jgi:hypothetical protein
MWVGSKKKRKAPGNTRRIDPATTKEKADIIARYLGGTSLHTIARHHCRFAHLTIRKILVEAGIPIRPPSVVAFVPTEEQIHEAKNKIRDSWSDAKRQDRSNGQDVVGVELKYISQLDNR